jgi:uncharacterized protein
MRVVLDTNILFSTLIPPHGFPDKIYQAWRSARFETVTSQEQLEEIHQASRYPKFKEVLQPRRVGTMVNNLQRAIDLERLNIDVKQMILTRCYFIPMGLLSGINSSVVMRIFRSRIQSSLSSVIIINVI